MAKSRENIERELHGMDNNRVVMGHYQPSEKDYNKRIAWKP